ncbi:MAG: hypothetical protein U1E15_03230 [Hyphomicrobiales bacterium]
MPLAQRIKSSVGGHIHGPKGLEGCDQHYEKATQAMAHAFRFAHAVIGICASGILIRAIAPGLRNKHREPAVVAVAEDGSSVIPLLGGHAGANDLARKIAATTGGHAAITTASDVVFGEAMDEPQAASLANIQDHKPAAAARLRGEAVRMETTIHRKQGNSHHLVYHPWTLAVGIGCERGTDPAEVKQLLDHTLAANNIRRALHFPVRLHRPEGRRSRHLAVFQCALLYRGAAEGRGAAPANAPSVVEAGGTPGVAEAAALALVGPNGKLIVLKVKSKRATLAIAEAAHHDDFQRHAGRARGCVSVVGIGPGDSVSPHRRWISEL